MAASADIALKVGYGNTVKYPVTAATTLYKGSMIAKTAGYALALTDGARFVGHAVEKVVNTTAAGYGSAGDLNVEVMQGKYKLQIALTGVNEYMVGAYVYAYDDNTYCLAPLRTPVGKVVQYVSSGIAIVEFDTNMHRGTMGGVVGIFEPFFHGVAGGQSVEANNSGVAGSWIRTSVNGAGIIQGYTVAAASSSPYCNGVLIIPDTAENDSESLQLTGAPFYLSPVTKPLFFGTRIKVADADQNDTIIGIGSADTALLAGWPSNISWRLVDASATAELIVEKADTETTSTSAATVVDDTFINLGFVFDGTYVYPYVNGTRGTALAITNLPNALPLTVSIEHTAGAATNTGLWISFLDAYQIL